NLFQKIEQLKNAVAGKNEVPEKVSTSISKVFHFSSLNRLIRAAGVLGNEPLGPSTLYQDDSSTYLLRVTMGDTTPTAFAKICNILSEYGDALRLQPGNEAYFEEHYTELIHKDAIEALSKL
ncbi:MAG: adaptor protein MecA, partial [Lachnospiraceae bacterium]|nr:adaptor protein MecA [Lachnospiraceae bacterium]